MAKPTGETDLDGALDELYRASPAEFTARRDALAKRLKDAGDAAGASEIKARRKPTQLAYVLNQLARRHEDDLAELVDVGRELARAQRKALRGEAGHDLRDAITRQRSVVAGLTSKTAALMGELGVPASGHIDEIASALRAALVDPAVGAQLEEGRLEKVPEPAAGFPGATLQLVRPEPAAETPRAKAHAPKHADARPHAEKHVAHVAPKAHAKANGHAHAKALAEERRRAASAASAASAAKEAKARAEEERAEERKEAERAKRRAAATAAGADAAARARAADEADREADGHAAQAKKLDDEGDALAAEAKRLAADAKRIAAEAKARAHEAEIARRNADRAATEAARATKRAKLARSEADRAVKHARRIEERV